MAVRTVLRLASILTIWAAAVPAALAVLLATFPAGPRRDRALGAWTVCGALGGAGGFVLGGLVTQAVGWRWLFAVPVVLGLAVVLAGWASLETGPRRPGQPDIAGAILGTGATLLLILGLTQAGEHGFAHWTAWLPLLLSVAAAAGFLAVERAVADPLVPPPVWSVPTLMLGCLVALVLTFATSGGNVIGTLFLQQVLELSAGASGAVFLTFSAAVAIGSAAASAVVRKLGRPRAMVAGLLVIAAAMIVSAAAVHRQELTLFLAGLSLSGAGLGAASVASTAHGTGTATEHNAGLFGGLLNAAAQIGTAVGVAMLLVGAAFAAGPPPTTEHTQVRGQVVAYLIAAVVALLAAIGTAVAGRRPQDQPGPTAPLAQTSQRRSQS